MEIRQYTTTSGKSVFGAWIDALKDVRAAARIAARLDRLAAGKAVGGGISELRVDCGPGYRIYYAVVNKKVVLLLCGGDKNRQQRDIASAMEYLKDYKHRSKEP